MKRTKALLLFSGGLDSILAAKILEEQNIDITALIFRSCFFDSGKAEKTAKELHFKRKNVNFSEDHIRAVKSPFFGYGKGLNPCIDCRIMMLKKAGEIMEKGKYDFVATGEVLGQRPMSQNRKSLEIIEEKSLLKGFLLRPLSAKLLKETVPEKLKQVCREKLLSIQGKSRKNQFNLAKKYRLKHYPNPAGGCLLTDPEFSKRMKRMKAVCENFNENDVFLMKTGRHFYCGKSLIVVGRDEKENRKIKKTAEKGDILVEMKKIKGPLTLVRFYGEKNEAERKIILKESERLTRSYSRKGKSAKRLEFRIKSAGINFLPF